MLGAILELNTLNRVKELAFLSPAQARALASATVVREAKESTPICASGEEREYAHILLSGSVAWTFVEARQGRRKLLKLLPPGVLPPLFDIDLHYEAFTNCKVGLAELERFFQIMLSEGAAAYRRLLDIHSRHWTATLPRSSKNFLGLATRQRLQLALLELCSDFGLPDSRGMLLPLSLSHQNLSDLIGTTRSKVTAALGDLERRGMIVRLGRRMAVRPDRIEPSLRELQPPRYAHARVAYDGSSGGDERRD